jgi:hypothetical protein
MENNTLLGATGDSTQQYDGSGVFNPNTPGADNDPNYVPAETDSSSQDSSEKPVDNTSNLLMYGGAALLLYYFFFKKK